MRWPLSLTLACLFISLKEFKYAWFIDSCLSIHIIYKHTPFPRLDQGFAPYLIPDHKSLGQETVTSSGLAHLGWTEEWRLVLILGSTFWKRFSLNWGLSSLVVVAFILMNSTAFSWALVSFGFTGPLVCFFCSHTWQLEWYETYQFKAEGILLFDFMRSRFTIIIAYNTVNRGRRSVRFTES